MRVEFTKMHGVGNDFAVFEAPVAAALLAPQRLRALADRRTGIGFDQALVLEPARGADSAVFYRVFNRDGDEVEQCGNGARCIAALLYRRGGGSGTLTLESPAGPVHARLAGGGDISVEMGVPDFNPRSLPFEAAAEADSYPLEVAGRTLAIGAVSIGNPHAVVCVEALDSAPVATLGPAIERHARFPKRVNAGFMEVEGRNRIRLRVYERGAGETLACGTGACAAVAVGRRRGLLDAEVQVNVRGGELRVNWAGVGASIWLTGPAKISYQGHLEI
jgi:diaminopimelate epimerase